MFSPPIILAHRHVQSVVTQAPWRRRGVMRNAMPLLASAQPEVIECGDGVRLQGYRSMPASGVPRGLVVLLHGWEGSAGSSYILSAGAALFNAGYSVFRLNFRDHGNTEALNEGLFHSCRLDEVYGAVRQLRSRSPGVPFAVVGQSLGGNFALRIAARASAEQLDITRILAICPVLKPHSTMHALDHGFWLYRRYFLARWRRSLMAKARAFPDTYQFGDLRRFRSLTDLTRFCVENYTEFATLDQYLTGYAITGAVLSDVALPARIITAADDPMIPIADLEQIARPASLAVDVVSRGGHCGFVDHWHGPSWVDREILSDLNRTMR